jgi:hypothetical protein
MFKGSDFQAINHIANRFGAEVIVTTEKDLSRIPDNVQLSIPLYAVGMGLLAKGDDVILKIVSSKVRSS